MDKLKIVKAAVFLLTFCLIFLLCFAISRVILKTNRQNQMFEISLPATNSRIGKMMAVYCNRCAGSIYCKFAR